MTTSFMARALHAVEPKLAGADASLPEGAAGVIELRDGRVVRDQVQGVYGLETV